MKDFIRTHQRCPCGESSDAYSVRTDQSGYCFSCGKNFSGKKEGETLDLDSVVEYDHVPFRGISLKTVKFYDVQTKFVDGDEAERAFPFSSSALKIKDVKEKRKQRIIGEFKDAGLFGLDRFDPGSKTGIVVTEGEEDSLAAYEMLLERMAVVSLKSGAGSARSCLSDPKIYEKVNSFDKIYLCFDADKQGQEAIQSVQGLFDFRKVYHVRLGKHKDANDYLLAGDVEDFRAAVYGSKRFAPDNIINSFDDISKALDESSEDRLGEYPFPELQSRLYGLHAGEVIVVKAPEGVGKTEFFRALEFSLLKTTSHPIGVIHLEEDNSTTIKAVAGYELEVPAVLPDCGLSKEDILSGYKRAVKDDEGRVHIHSSFDVENEDAFVGNIRFLVSAAGCRFIFLDHISWLATGLEDDDERKKLDRISQKLKLLAKELRFCLIEISHVNDDGKTRGSRNISKVANTVISLSRDLLGGDNRMFFLVEKARLGGRTGPAGYATYNQDTGRLEAPPEIPEL